MSEIGFGPVVLRHGSVQPHAVLYRTHIDTVEKAEKGENGREEKREKGERGREAKADGGRRRAGNRFRGGKRENGQEEKRKRRGKEGGRRRVAEADPSASELFDGGKRPLLRPLFRSKLKGGLLRNTSFEQNMGWSGGPFPVSDSSEADGPASAGPPPPPSPFSLLFLSPILPLPLSKSIRWPPPPSSSLSLSLSLPSLFLLLSFLLLLPLWCHFSGRNCSGPPPVQCAPNRMVRDTSADPDPNPNRSKR